MLRGNNGFTLLETIIATTIIFIIIAVSYQVNSHIKMEQKVMEDRRAISYAVHGELLLYIYNKKNSDLSKDIVYKEVSLTVSFIYNKGLIKACTRFENIMEREEVICLHGWVGSV